MAFQMFNSEQKKAFSIAISGHNMIILGAAGTGKTFLIQHLVKEFAKNGKTVALTATTGIACSLYQKATTIHRWTGIGDGRFAVSDIRKVIECNVKYSDVRKRIMDTDILIIDECSMLSKRMFEAINEVCMFKNTNLLFGGIQIILCGDMRQLPPVPNQLYADEGEFCFQSDLFQRILPHRVTLTGVIRQNEKDLIKAIEEVSKGIISADTQVFIDSLKRPLPLGDEPVKLFARNEQVDKYNRQKIIAFPGQLYEYQSKDEGEFKYLNKIMAPKVLWLKINMPVILLRNLSDKLVNGLQGTVVEITETGPVVEFLNLNVTVPLQKEKFTVFSPSRNTDVAVRLQYPIKPCFAITIHKSQGMTLERLEVDCHQIFKPGQLGVALGRARQTKGLGVINFNSKSSVIAQPSIIQSFLEQSSLELKEDISCCQNIEQRYVFVYSPFLQWLTSLGDSLSENFLVINLYVLFITNNWRNSYVFHVLYFTMAFYLTGNVLSKFM